MVSQTKTREEIIQRGLADSAEADRQKAPPTYLYASPASTSACLHDQTLPHGPSSLPQASTSGIAPDLKPTVRYPQILGRWAWKLRRGGGGEGT